MRTPRGARRSDGPSDRDSTGEQSDNIVYTDHASQLGQALRENESKSFQQGPKTCDDELRLAISRTWNNVDEQRKVAEKLRLEGVLTCHDLVDLMQCHAPRDDGYLLRWSWFRGQPCMCTACSIIEYA